MIELDWQVTDISSGEQEPALPEPGPAQRPKPGKGRLSWRALALTLLALAGLAALVPALLAWIGWQRLRTEIQAEVAYEDARSFSGDGEIVRALQSRDNPEWVRLRLYEANLGLPASLPAPNLLPVAESARILELAVPNSDLIEARVLRKYADSAGQQYSFEVTQRYRRTGPGLWQRLAPDESLFQETSTWSGQRLIATYPVVDEAWMEQALPELDGYLARACAEWACPASIIIPVTFTGVLGEMPNPAATLRASGPAAGAYPIAFDLRPPYRLRYPMHTILPSPHLAGFPHDDRAAAALTRTTAVVLLGHLASELSTASPAYGHYLQAALVARAEIRLGLSASPAFKPDPQQFLPPQSLWDGQRSELQKDLRTDIATRMEALSFLNFMLGSQSPSMEALLLTNLRRPAGLGEWLESGLGLETEPLIAQWAASAAAELAANYPPKWEQLDGLAYSCGETLQLVRDANLQSFSSGVSSIQLVPSGLSLDGRHLAFYDNSGSAQIQIIDLSAQGSVITSPAVQFAFILGWTGDAQLAYLTETTLRDFQYRLMLYDPATDTHAIGSRRRILPPEDFSGSWSPDHNSLGLTLLEYSGPSRSEPRTMPAVLSLAEAGGMLIPGRQGYSPTISPDGQKIAYVVGVSPWGPDADSHIAVESLDLANQIATPLFITAEMAADSHSNRNIHGLRWTPDGRLLVYSEYTLRGDSLFALAADGSGMRPLKAAPGSFYLIGFSADSRYLGLIHNLPSDNRELVIIDLQSGAEQIYPASQVAWSPRGHLLAVAGLAGVSVADPADGKSQWLLADDSGSCNVAWYALP